MDNTVQIMIEDLIYRLRKDGLGVEYRYSLTEHGEISAVTITFTGDNTN